MDNAVIVVIVIMVILVWAYVFTSTGRKDINKIADDTDVAVGDALDAVESALLHANLAKKAADTASAEAGLPPPKLAPPVIHPTVAKAVQIRQAVRQQSIKKAA